MPQARRWTEAADNMICSLRGAGATWADIGRTLGLSRNTVIERGRRLHAQAPLRPVPEPGHADISEDLNRSALPPGHPLTWGLLSEEPYPARDAK